MSAARFRVNVYAASKKTIYEAASIYNDKKLLENLLFAKIKLRSTGKFCYL
jgi:hypothetical protein